MIVETVTSNPEESSQTREASITNQESQAEMSLTSTHHTMERESISENLGDPLFGGAPSRTRSVQDVSQLEELAADSTQDVNLPNTEDTPATTAPRETPSERAQVEQILSQMASGDLTLNQRLDRLQRIQAEREAAAQEARDEQVLNDLYQFNPELLDVDLTTPKTKLPRRRTDSLHLRGTQSHSPSTHSTGTSSLHVPDNTTSNERLVSLTPNRRNMREFVASAMRQSMGRPSRYSTVTSALDDITESDDESEEVRVDGDSLVIAGVPLTLMSTPRSQVECGPVRLWDKRERDKLTPEARLAFINSATGGWVLPKGSKLSAPLVVMKDDKLLAHVETLQAQIRMLQIHMERHDIVDVMTVVVPINVQESMKIENRCYNLFDDYTQLHPEIVANSCTWYNRWVADPFVRENMALTYSLLQRNTEPTCIWNVPTNWGPEQTGC